MMLLSSALKPSIQGEAGFDLLRKLPDRAWARWAACSKMFFVARIDAQRVDYRAAAHCVRALARLDGEFSVLCQSGAFGALGHTNGRGPMTACSTASCATCSTTRGALHGSGECATARHAKRGPWVVCQVWDTGVGIPRQYRHRIFDDFFQAHNIGRPQAAGLGLGLAVAPAQPAGADAGGCCRRPGRGTCFSVRLPAATGARRPTHRQTTSCTVRGARISPCPVSSSPTEVAHAAAAMQWSRSGPADRG